MIILEVESAILRNLLERYLDPNEKLSGDYWFCDFDGVRFHVCFSSDEKKKKKKGETDGPVKEEVTVEMMIGCAKELNEYGAEEAFEELYGPFKAEPSNDKKLGINYTHAIKFDLKSMAPEEQKKVITLAARLKANMLGAPFMWVAEQVKEKSNFSPFAIPYRGATGESFYITPTDFGAACTFSIRFSDPGDKVIGGVFFQELAAARQRVRGAPIVTYSNDVPSDLQALAVEITGDKSLYAYVTISMQADQLSDRKKRDTADYLPMFRDYLHYHIKCAKAFMHQKMRSRTAAMLRVLDAAKPEPKQKIRRTITGKIMK